jgi:prophage maintenance system killer protein
MVWYPSVDDVVCTNIEVLDLTGDRHPHKLLSSREGIQAIIDEVKRQEDNGLTYQAAHLLKDLAGRHFFAGANHRTAYVVAKMFLVRNGRQLRVDSFEDAYPFIKNVEARNIEEIRRWIEHGAQVLKES